jgi:uncharacterized protein YicC (UPF0701 family)
MAQKRAIGGVASMLPEAPGGAGNVDQIREILFGGQMREYSRRFAQLEERLVQDLARTSDDLEARIGLVEKFARGELQRLGEKLQQEREARLAAMQEFEEQLSRFNQHLSAGIDRVSADTGRELTRVRQELSDEVRQMQTRLRDQQEELQGQLAQQTGQLQENKVDQSDLADVFNELGMRLRGDFSIPDATAE